jgi:hypothetical protein
VLKGFYCSPQPHGQSKRGKYALIVVVILSAWDFDAPQALFKLRMKSNLFQAMAEAVALATDKVNVIFYTMRLLIICGQMFMQQLREVGMLEF